MTLECVIKSRCPTMARTYRRKNNKSHTAESWNSYNECVRNWYRRRYPGKTDKEIIHLKDVEYHCDNHPGEWNPPSGYSRWLNKKVKNKNRLKLIRVLRTGEEFVEIPIKRDSGYQYF